MPDAPIPSEPRPPSPWWVWLNNLGLDAVLAALCWMPLFAKVTGAQLVRGEYVVLGCAVWCLYAMDRIMDGSMTGGLRGERHLFAVRCRPLLLGGIVIAASVSGWILANNVREIVAVWGLRFMGAVLLYFFVTWISRRNWTGVVGAGGLAGFLAIALMQGTDTENLWAQLWRGVFAGFLITVIFLSLRQTGAPAPWTLPRKLLGGWLFAAGTALAPYAHLEQWPHLILKSQVILFGIVCGLNSLGIRLWEMERGDFEQKLLERLHPLMLVTAAAGAAMECFAADRHSRPLFIACGAAALLLLVLHLTRRRTSVTLRRTLADAAIIVSALAVLWL